MYFDDGADPWIESEAHVRVFKFGNSASPPLYLSTIMILPGMFILSQWYLHSQWESIISGSLSFRPMYASLLFFYHSFFIWHLYNVVWMKCEKGFRVSAHVVGCLTRKKPGSLQSTTGLVMTLLSCWCQCLRTNSEKERHRCFAHTCCKILDGIHHPPVWKAMNIYMPPSLTMWSWHVLFDQANRTIVFSTRIIILS